MIFVVAGPVVEMKGDEMTRYGKMMDKGRVDKLLFSSVKMSSGNSNWHELALYFCKGSTLSKPIFYAYGSSKNKFLVGGYR